MGWANPIGLIQLDGFMGSPAYVTRKKLRVGGIRRGMSQKRSDSENRKLKKSRLERVEMRSNSESRENSKQKTRGSRVRGGTSLGPQRKFFSTIVTSNPLTVSHNDNF